jgi:Ca2+-binding EF-hand superfamily protein
MLHPDEDRDVAKKQFVRSGQNHLNKSKELRTVLGTIFNEWDENKDGLISKEELEDGMKTFDLHL